MAADAFSFAMHSYGKLAGLPSYVSWSLLLSEDF